MSPQNTHLIIIEGLPGSGKTNLAQFVAGQLVESGRKKISLYLEGNLEHPADYESVACLSKAEYAGLLADFPGWESSLAQAGWVQGEEHFFSYRKLKGRLPEALWARLAAYEIYERPVEQFQRLYLQRWRAFAHNAALQKVVYIFECCLFQNPITFMMGRNNIDPQTTQAFILEIAQTIQPLNPALIYLDMGSARASLERVIPERPKEWLDYIIAYHTEQGLGKAMGWSGLEGLLQFMEARRAVERELFDRLEWRSLWVQQVSLEQTHRLTAAFLKTL